MSSSGEWHYAGKQTVNENNRIAIPEPVLEAGILSAGERAYWSYEKTVGFLIVSNGTLEKQAYKSIASSKIGDESDRYRCTIPKRFFTDYEGRGKGRAQQERDPVPEEARVSYDEPRYFVYRTPMTEGRTRSCYLLTQGQLENTITVPDEWETSLGELPRFLQNG